MSKDFSVGPMQDSSVLLIYSQRGQIQMNPTYQREGGIWTPEKRQLLVDSIINGFDIPKLYFHDFSPMKTVGSKKYRYAIVDGRQRLEAIWAFIDDAFSLPNDFEYLHDDHVKAGGLTYSGLAQEYPELKMRFDAKTLPITLIRTNEIDLIEEMFSRLNEAVPLNAAEKRNAWGGPIPPVVRAISKHRFFTEKVKVSSKRYKHQDIATKFLLFEFHKKVVDTKKIYLDNFVKQFRGQKPRRPKTLQVGCEAVMNLLAMKFSKADPLLSSVGMLSLYYLLFRDAKGQGWYDKIQRSVFTKFENDIKRNRDLAALSNSDEESEENPDVDYNLLEFSRLGQSPNDASAIRFRLEVLTDFVKTHLKIK